MISFTSYSTLNCPLTLIDGFDSETADAVTCFIGSWCYLLLLSATVDSVFCPEALLNHQCSVPHSCYTWCPKPVQCFSPSSPRNWGQLMNYFSLNGRLMMLLWSMLLNSSGIVFDQVRRLTAAGLTYTIYHIFTILKCFIQSAHLLSSILL